MHPNIDGVVDGHLHYATDGPKEKLWHSFGGEAIRTFWCITCGAAAKSSSFIWPVSANGRELRMKWCGGYRASHPFLALNWSLLRERINGRVELFDIRSPYVQTLVQSLRLMNLDLADLSPPLLATGGEASSRELVTQLRLLRSTLDVKLDQFERIAGKRLWADSERPVIHHDRSDTRTTS